MKYVIVFTEQAFFKNELSTLKHPDMQFSLITSAAMERELSPNNRQFFHTIHMVPNLTFENVTPVTNHYFAEYGRDSVTLTTDDEWCMRLLGQLSESLGLQEYSLQNRGRFINKHLMKQYLSKSKLRIPHHVLFDLQQYQNFQLEYLQDIAARIKYPLIAKPLDGVGSINVQKIYTQDEFVAWADQVNESTYTYEIEEFIDGVLYHCNALIKDKQVIHSTVEEYTWPCALFDEGYNLGSICLPEKDPRWQRLDDFHRQVIACLEPPDGATHCEIFINQANELAFLEIAARACGALVVPIYEKAVGLNLETLHFKLQLGQAVELNPIHQTHYYTWAFIPLKEGKVEELLQPTFNSECEFNWNIKLGDVIHNPHEKNMVVFRKAKQAGTIILQNTNFEQLYEDFLKLRTADFIKVS